MSKSREMDKAALKKNIILQLSFCLANMMPEDLPLGGAESERQIRRFNDAKTELLREFDRRMGIKWTPPPSGGVGLFFCVEGALGLF